MGCMLLFLIACTDDISDNISEYESAIPNDIEVFEVSNVEAFYSYENAGVLDIYGPNSPIDPNAKSDDDEEAGDHPLTLVLTVDSPLYNGTEPLSATHIHIADGYAYVSYNKAGSIYLGAVDIIDIGNAALPKLTARLIFSNADLNGVRYHNGYVYAVGGLNSELSEIATANAFVAQIPVEGEDFEIDSGISYGFQEGNQGIDVAINGDQVLAASAIQGHLSQYNSADMSVIADTPFEDLRSIAVDGSNIALLEANMGIRILNTEMNFIKDIPIDSDFSPESKRTIDLVDDRMIVAQGSYGAGIYSLSSGQLKEQIPILLHPEGVADEDIVTNAVSSNKDMIFLANGGGGLSLSLQKEDGSTELAGVIGLEGSINFVTSQDDYLVAASGTRGVQVVKFNRPSESLLARCEELPEYRGSANLNVLIDEELAFKGSKKFNNINNSGALLLCGSWSVHKDMFINDQALFELYGLMAVGKNNQQSNVQVAADAVMKLEGELTIYGDLILGDGATLECIGDANSINIYGEVIKGDNVTISGSFDDVQDKF